MLFAYTWDGEVPHLQIYIISSGLLPESHKKGPDLDAPWIGAGLPLELFSMFASVARIVSGGPLHSTVNYIKDVRQNEQVFLEKN